MYLKKCLLLSFITVFRSNEIDPLYIRRPFCASVLIDAVGWAMYPSKWLIMYRVRR